MKLNQLFVALAIAILVGLYACESEPASTTMAPEWAELPYESESAEAVAALQEGLAITDIGNSPKAYEAFSKAAEADPNLVTAHVYKAWFSPSAKEFGENAKAVAAMRDQANDTEKILIEMTSAFAKGDADKQLELSNQLVQANPDVARAYVYLGFTLDGMNDHQKAREQYMKAIELAPQWPGGYSLLSNSYIFNEPKNFAKATENAQKVVELAPGDSRAQTNLGDCYRADQNLDGALQAYAKATELNPQDNIAYMKVGHVSSLLGNYDQARKSYQSAARYSPNPIGAINFEAFTYLYAGDHEAALAYMDERADKLADLGVPASSLNDASLNCTNICSMIAMHNNDVERVDALNAKRKPLGEQQAKDVGTSEAAAYSAANQAYWEGIALAMKNDYEGCLAKAEENRKLLDPINDPTKLDEYNFLMGYLGIKNEDYDNAVAHFEQTDTDIPYNKYMLAVANEKQGDTETAMKLYNELAHYNFNGVGYALVRNDVLEKIKT